MSTDSQVAPVFVAQLVFYFVWGNLLASWSFYFSAMMSQTRVAGGHI